MELREKAIKSEQVYDGKFLHVVKDTVMLPDGKEGSREYVIHPGAVIVVPITKENTVILEKQYRHSVKDILIEVPSGKLDFAGEDPLSAAKRELREETGFTAKTWKFMGNLLPLAAYSTETSAMFIATDLEKGETSPDDDEFIEIFELPLEEVFQMVINGTITDGNTQVAIMKAKSILGL